MKIYAISMLAISPLKDADDKSENTYVEQLPALVPAESIEDAAEAARKAAIERWKPDEGWYGHQADILPVTKVFYDAAFNAYRAGTIDMTDEEGQTFKF